MAENEFCAGCLRGNETNTGEAWCCDCAKLLCKTCSGFHKKLSPPHKVVPVEKVSSLNLSLLTLSRNCEVHIDQKIAFFCCQDDKLICGSCVSESHKTCKQVISIEEAATDVQHGTAITDLENRIDSLSHAMEKVVHLYSNQISSLNDKKKDFKKKVGDIRKKIIAYLDKIEEDFKKESDTNYKECSEILMKNKSEIQSRYDRLTTWKKDMVSLKHYTSNVQLFHVIKYLDAKTHSEETEFRKFKTDATIPTLNFKIAETMSKIRATLPSFGDLSIDNRTIPSSPDLDIDQQGQAFVRSEVPSTKPTLVTSFKTSVLGVGVTIYRGCFVPDNTLLLCGSYKVYVCDHDGSNTKTIVLDNDPCDVTLYDRDTALVSIGDKGIQIIDMKILKPGKRIKVGSNCTRITSLNGKIWVRSDHRTLTMIDIKGIVQKEITTSFSPWYICLTKDGNIHCTDSGSYDVYIVTSDGGERVVYSSPNLRGSDGITVDNHGDVYIAGCASHNIHRISSDGQQSNIILTKEDGIIFPKEMSFNHQTKDLMVVNNVGTCINIYKVS